MMYQSKKDPSIEAAFDFQNEKTKTIRMIYLTGEKAGYSFDIEPSTLKRWWKKMDTTEQEEDTARINAPYHPDVTPHYIEKPESVKRYEEEKALRRKGKRVAQFEGPKDYEQFADWLGESNVELKRVNSGYISLPDNSKLKILTSGIGILASQELGEKFIEKGFTARSCIEKGTPFRFDITTQDEYNNMWEILKSL